MSTAESFSPSERSRSDMAAPWWPCASWCAVASVPDWSTPYLCVLRAAIETRMPVMMVDSHAIQPTIKYDTIGVCLRYRRSSPVDLTSVAMMAGGMPGAVMTPERVAVMMVAGMSAARRRKATVPNRASLTRIVLSVSGLRGWKTVYRRRMPHRIDERPCEEERRKSQRCARRTGGRARARRTREGEIEDALPPP